MSYSTVWGKIEYIAATKSAYIDYYFRKNEPRRTIWTSNLKFASLFHA